MAYRTRARRDDEPRPPDRVVTLAQYGPAWLIAAALWFVTGIGFGVSQYGSTSLACTREKPEATPSCALVVDGVFGERRRRVEPSPSSVEPQVAELNDEGKRSYLVVRADGDPLAFFDVGAQNGPIAESFGTFLRDPMALAWSRHLSTSWYAPAMCALCALALALPVVLMQKKRRYAIWQGEGILLVEERGLLRPKQQRYELDAIAGVVDESDDGTDWQNLVLRMKAGEPVRIGQGGGGAVARAKLGLEAALAEHAKLAKKTG